ncbi:hypothetical protein K504DRAFT_494932 [Pleomassaria siparia CBS 279.74]|uniref:Peptidase S33 tripeptidyl aminopeptidase-like C-terminal domain-containing protein n=1 Tax=Pleomassaria siparia CBS 279.74 TaxID=1314801 RepID=A0A6G1JUF4_9PLEO|nr:hypothetical protein K504DRAFT_494932 [Pleomassaria siparia CBS 279.74]
MVLDGVLQHSQAESSNILVESTVAWVATNDASPLKGQDVEKLWYDILKNTTDTPMPAPDCSGRCHKDVTEDEIRLNAQGFLLSPQTLARTQFANALLQASQGDVTLLSTSLPEIYTWSLYVGLAIGCQDWALRTSSFEDFQAKIRIGEVFAPLNKGASQSWSLQASCIGWPAPLANPPAKLKVQTKDPILMVSVIRDPSTSYTWAVGMLEEIENHVLLTRNGDGHTSWGFGGVTTDAINHFLVTTEPPAPGTVLDS